MVRVATEMARNLNVVGVGFRVIAVLALLSLPALGLGQEQGNEMARFAGLVTDMDQKPIVQAVVQVKNLGTGQRLSEKTNKKGQFTFAVLMPGKYSVTAEKEGYMSFAQEFALEPGGTPQIQINLAAESSKEQKARQEALDSFRNGISLAQADKLDEALESFRKAVTLKPDFAEAHVNMGLLLYRQGKGDEAEMACLKALELKSEEPRIKEVLADIYFEMAKEMLQRDKIDEALDKLKLSADLNPGFPFTHYLLGYAYAQKGMKEEAIKSFEAFIQLEPNAPQAAKAKDIIENLKKQK